jgi:hypothetical protein
MSVWERNQTTGEPGFEAVRKEFGDDMVQRVKNWPRLAAVYAEAQYTDPESDVGKATRDMNRARTDREFALDQARRSARSMPRDRWAIVPSAAQLQRQWEFDKPIGYIRRADLPPVRPQKLSVRTEIDVDEEEVRRRRKMAAEAAARISRVMGPHTPVVS